MKARSIIVGSLLGALIVGVAGFAAADMGTSSNDEAQREMQSMYRLRAVAGQSKDVLKINCVNDKLVLAKALMNMVDRSQGGTGELHALRQEAESCVGKSGINVTNANSYTAPMIRDSPFANDPWLLATVEAPAYASPFN